MEFPTGPLTVGDSPVKEIARLQTPLGAVRCLLLEQFSLVKFARLCVQRRLACSARGNPAGVRISSPVAWIAGRRETKVLKPIDGIFLGEIASHRAVTKVNARVAPKVSRLEGRARNLWAKAAWAAEC